MSSNRLGSRGKTKHCYKNLTKTTATMSSPSSENNSHLDEMKQESHLGTKIPNLSHFVLGNNPQKSNPKRTNSTIHYYSPNSTQGWIREESNKKNNSNFTEDKSVIKEVKREPGSPVLLQDQLLHYHPHQHYLDSSSHKTTECQKGLSASTPIAAFHHVDIKREPCEEGDSMELQNLLSTLSPPPYISPLAVCNPSHEIPHSLLCHNQQQEVLSSYAPHPMFGAQQESYLATSAEYSHQQTSKTDHHFDHPLADHMFSDKRTFGLMRADELPACCSSYARDGHLNFSHTHGYINHPCFSHPTQHQQRQHRSEDMTSSSPVSTASSSLLSSPLSNEASP